MLIIVRHTEWSTWEDQVEGQFIIDNTEGFKVGQGLTKKGASIARETALELKKIVGDKEIILLSSPIPRAKLTADIIAERCGGEIIEDDDLSESGVRNSDKRKNIFTNIKRFISVAKYVNVAMIIVTHSPWCDKIQKRFSIDCRSTERPEGYYEKFSFLEEKNEAWCRDNPSPKKIEMGKYLIIE
jgi:phosphohistidine phosphatase SixA